MGLGIFGMLLLAVAADRTFSRALREQQDTAATAATVLAAAALDAEFERLDLIARDLGTGDQVYRFALFDDPDFRHDRLGTAALDRLAVDFVLLVNSAGDLRAQYVTGFGEEAAATVPELTEFPALRQEPDAQGGLRHIAEIAGESVLVAVRPVTSGGEGVLGRGSLLVGVRTQQWLSTLALGDEDAVTVAVRETSVAAGEPITVRDGVGQVVLPDIGRGTAYVLRVEPDDGAGRFIFRLLLGTIVLIACTVIVLMWVGFDGRVLGRLRAIEQELTDLAEDPNANLRIPGSWGGDEIGAVTRATDTVLATVVARTDRRVEEAREATASQIFGEHVVRAMAEGVIVIDADGTCRACNPVAARLLGGDANDLLGRRDALDEYLPAAVVATARTRAAAGDGTPQPLQRDGADMMLTAAEFRRRPDAEPGLILLLRDVSTERRAERLQRGIVSVVSHELRTPLTVIDSTLTLLREQIGERLEPGEMRVVDLLDANAERMHELVNDLLDFSALESGELSADMEPFDLVDLAEEVQRLHAPRSLESEIEVQVRASRSPLVVHGDRQRLRQVLTNLLGNAVKYSGAQGRVWLDLHDLGEGGVRVDVTDTGHGIPVEDQPRVFDQFFRASNARRTSRGTGLGLAISRQIAAMHEGRLLLTRSGEDGSTFTLYLPPDDAGGQGDRAESGGVGPRDGTASEDSAAPRARAAPASPLETPDATAETPTATETGEASGD